MNIIYEKNSWEKYIMVMEIFKVLRMNDNLWINVLNMNWYFLADEEG
jgi:hypothetical protein